MKGVIFTELIEMIENLMGLKITNEIIEDAGLENQGAYTAAGTYPYQDLVKLMESLSKHSSTSKEKLLWSYGEYLFYRLTEEYAKKLSESPNAFDFIQQLEQIISMEILKYNPRVSQFMVRVIQQDKNTLEVLYDSEKRISQLIEGALAACIKSFPENISLERKDLTPDGSKVRFILKKVSHG